MTTDSYNVLHESVVLENSGDIYIYITNKVIGFITNIDNTTDLIYIYI